MQTPVDVIQRHRLRIIAELNFQTEQDAEMKEKQEEAERDARRNR